MRLHGGEMAEASRLARLYRGLRQRELVRGDPVGTRVLEGRLRATLAGVAREVGPDDARELPGPPPRRIAIAMALALFSQPHLAQTFTGVPRPAILFDNDVLRDALGISGWELDDLRDEVDRRAGTWLKQETVAHWLEAHLPPEKAFAQLFPGVTARGTVRFERAHVVASAPAAPLPRTGMFLPWVSRDGLGPLDAFRGRYVDGNLKRALERSLGLTAEEVDELLERTVLFVPQASADDLLALDAWRRDGFAALTGIGQPYGKLSWLVEPVDGASARWRTWLAPPDADVPGPEAAFDMLLEPRIHGMLEALQGEILARRWIASEPFDDVLDVLDVPAHVSAVTQPLLAWAGARGSTIEIAQAGQIPLDVAETLLAEVHTTFKQRAASWARPPSTEWDGSPQACWMRRLVRLDEALRVVGDRMPLGVDHREVVFLYAAHFLAESPPDRAVLSATEDGGSVGLAVSRWFWPTWRRVLEHAEDEGNTTNAELLVPDGLF
ncbi:MAG: hypothetical protein KC656_00050 [Myxococcales bacterium]|nr:hypothetical protein [Myxococcales bacterium]